MNKYVTTFFLLNKTIPFLLTKPLYDPFCQCSDLLSKHNLSWPQASGHGFEKQTAPYLVGHQLLQPDHKYFGNILHSLV